MPLFQNSSSLGNPNLLAVAPVAKIMAFVLTCGSTRFMVWQIIAEKKSSTLTSAALSKIFTSYGSAEHVKALNIPRLLNYAQ